ncbi:MAG TPA: winged helix-turn-helix domain-containing protein [Nitrosopumilaceae archaeon]|nr:winged helix-turn-helix domain-containing protein [Nitrosopumilaceae archaeon]
MRDERRDTLAILSDLLEYMHEPRRLTHILYASNLSYSQLCKYLKMLVEMGLAQKQTKPFNSFRITHEGKYFVSLISRRTKVINPIPNVSKSI